MLSSNKISDVDANGGAEPCVCVLGGFYGEFVNVVTTFEKLANDMEKEGKDPEEASMDFSFFDPVSTWKNTVYEKIIPALLANGPLDGATVELSFKKNIDEELAAIHETIKMDNIGEENIGRNKKRLVRQLLMDQLGSKFTSILEQNLELLGIREKTYNNIKKAFGTCLVKALCAPALTVSLEPETELQAFLKTIPEDEILPVGSDEDMDQEPLEGDEGEQEKIEAPKKTLAEMELHDKVTVIAPNGEGARVLMYHQPAAVLLRREIMNAFSDEIQQIGTSSNDIAILNEINKQADRLEQVVIKDNWAKDLAPHYFEYKLY